MNPTDRQVWLTEQQHHQMKVVAAKKKLTMRALVTEWLKREDETRN